MNMFVILTFLTGHLNCSMVPIFKMILNDLLEIFVPISLISST